MKFCGQLQINYQFLRRHILCDAIMHDPITHIVLDRIILFKQIIYNIKFTYSSDSSSANSTSPYSSYLTAYPSPSSSLSLSSATAVTLLVGQMYQWFSLWIILHQDWYFILLHTARVVIPLISKVEISDYCTIFLVS